MSENWKLVVSDVGVSYGDRNVLSNVNLEFHANESVALVGPSGCGKTTLLSIIGGLMRPSVGSVQLQSAAGQLAPLRYGVSWVLQTTNAMGRRTTLDNVLLGSMFSTRTDSERARAADEALSSVGLHHRRQVPARKLSGGEAQRLAIARAIVADRPFILADEPTGQLDAKTTGTVLDALFSRHAVGLIIATHDQNVWERCDRAVRLTDVGQPPQMITSGV